jgi:DUF3048 family protein
VTLSTRGKVFAAVGGVLAAAILGVLVYSLISGESPIDVAKKAVGVDPPPACPLTGQPAPGGEIPQRPVLAVKVENTEEARPQVGLDKADVVYEEVVEGGITRFISIFHCRQSRRVGPVRSARLTDAEVLAQFGEKPILAFSGGTNRVAKEISRSGIQEFDETSGGSAFERDPSRTAPHDLFVSTLKLLKIAKTKKAVAPEPVFTYAEEYGGRSKKAGSLSMTFSDLNTVGWDWDGGNEMWLRLDDGTPNELEDGTRLATKNVVVQFVKVNDSDIQDVTGSPSPEVKLIGHGKAYVFREGQVVVGRWERGSLEERTTFTDRAGDEIPLVPGQTWVELYPAGGNFTEGAFSFSKK